LVGLLGLNANHLVSAAADCTVRIWDPARGVCLRVLAAHSAAITCFQHDGSKVISGSDGNLKMWDFKTGKFVRNLLTGLGSVWQVKFDERRCVAAVQRAAANGANVPHGLTYFEVRCLQYLCDVSPRIHMRNVYCMSKGTNAAL